MDYISFAQIKLTFTIVDNLPGFKCIGIRCTPKHPCDGDLLTDRKANAKELLQKDVTELDDRDRLNIILLLLCHVCQETDTQKKKIKAKWERESGLDFGWKGCRSSYSLRPSRSKGSIAQHSSQTTDRRSNSTSVQPPMTDEHGGHGAPLSPSEASAVGTQRNATTSPLPSRDADTEHNSENEARDATNLANGIAPAGSDPQTSETQIPEPQTPEPQTPEPQILGPQTPTGQQGRSRRSSPPARGALLERLSSSQAFYWGKSRGLAPWTLRLELLRCLLEPVPSSIGYIYAVKTSNHQFVKIGKTTTPPKSRISDISADHGIPLDVQGALWSQRIPRLQLDRLEQLVFKELEFFRIDLLDNRGKKPRTHGEYFDVELDDAKRVIDRWWNNMRSIGVEPGHEVDSQVQDYIYKAIANVAKPTENTDVNEKKRWRIENSDRRRESAMWDNAFRVHEGGFRKPRSARKMIPSFEIVSFLVLICLLPPPWRIFFGFTFFWLKERYPGMGGSIY